MIWEYRPVNKYELVYVDSIYFPGHPPPGIHTALFAPTDVGDLDGDGLTDILGVNIENTKSCEIVCVHESKTPFRHPDTMVWFCYTGNNGININPCITDLDQDGRKEIIFAFDSLRILECRGDNQYENVFSLYNFNRFATLAFGDYDGDGRMEIASVGDWPEGGGIGIQVMIAECIGDDQYAKVCSIPIPLYGIDVFGRGDGDGDGKPDFFIGFQRLLGGLRASHYLYHGKGIGPGQYQCTFVDSIRTQENVWGKRSQCGDVDADGLDEIIWSVGVKVFVYDWNGSRFEKVWEWNRPSGEVSVVNVYDMNRNGYQEIVISGLDSTYIYELEAVRLTYPNGGQSFRPGNTLNIHWQTFYPPPCDSLSLFYSIDNGRTYRPITLGISGTDTSYLWTVPDVRSDSCKIKVIAYGPGWQYDESDGLFSIKSTGIEEREVLIPRKFNLAIQPNLIRKTANIKLSIPEETNIRLLASDISGKIVKTLIKGRQKPGVYNLRWNGDDESNRKLPSGLYFLILSTTPPEKKIIKKVLFFE